MKKKLVNQKDGYKIYEVDGNEVRRLTNCEFTNFGQHGRFSFIPSDEIWLDKEYGRGERSKFERYAIIEAEAMKNGKNYNDACDEWLVCEGNNENAKRNVYKKIITYVGDIKVWLVDGKNVREGYSGNFTQGGHRGMYAFIPKDEVWIDDDLSEQERKPVMIHELNELRLMRKGVPYNKAHFRSNIKENKFRKLFKKNKYPSLKVIN